MSDNTNVVLLRAPVREKIIIHCNSDEIAQAGRALMEMAERAHIPTDGTLTQVTSVATGRPMFTVERSRLPSSQTIKMWSCALGHGPQDAA